MSSEGTAAAPLLLLAGPAMAAMAVAGLAVGAGILIVRGAMWCGEKLEQNYQHACREWTDLAEAARTDNLSRVQAMGSAVADQLECMAYARASAYVPTSTTTPATLSQAVVTEEQRAVAEALARAWSTLNDAQSITYSKAQADQQLLAYRLQAEIANSRGILPPQQLAAAEAALHDSSAAMQQAIDALQQAWLAVTEAQAVRTRHTRQAQQALSLLSAKLASLDASLLAQGGTQHQAYADRRHAINTQLREAQALLDTNPERALTQAESAQQSTRALIEIISSEAFAQRDKVRSQINVQLGMLDALSKMVLEASGLQLVDAQKIAALSERISKAQSAAHKVVQGNVDQVSRLPLFIESVNVLKDDVFRAIKKSQQSTIAQTIAGTLAELDFTSSSGGQPELKKIGDMLRIQVTRPGSTTGFERDDKVVSFDISRDGDISYDFSGYIGESCLQDAANVFAALRDKGLFILDPQAADRLRQIPTENINVETLSQAHLQPHLTQNKPQAELAEQLRRVLEQMNYPTIRQRVVGGTIELEAFKDNIGYHVVLSPEGDVQVLKDAERADVSNDESDQIVTEAKRTLAQAREKAVTREKPKSTPVQQRRQQLSGN